MYRWTGLTAALAGCLVAVSWSGSSKGEALRRDDARVMARQAVHEALTLGIAGDQAGRVAKLGHAIARDTDCELARWHLGQIHWNDEWLSVREVEAALANDPLYKAYLKKRETLAGDPAQDLSLGRWCVGQQRPDLARFHFQQVLLHPASPDDLRGEALERLELQLYDGAWRTKADIDARVQQGKVNELAAKKWSPHVKRWTQSLLRGHPKQARYARDRMHDVDDVAIIPILENRMSSAGEGPAREVVRWLAMHESHEATDSLLRHALDAPWSSVQQAAIDALADRPLHDFVPQLLGQLVPPIESNFSVRVSPIGGVRHQHELFRAGSAGNELARADFLDMAWKPATWKWFEPAVPATARSKYNVQVTKQRPAGAHEQPSLWQQAQEASDMIQRIQWLALQAKMRTAMIEQNVAQWNQSLAEHNRRIFLVLEGSTGADCPDQPTFWWDWWEVYNEQYSPPKNTRYSYGWQNEYSGPAYHLAVTRMSCFAAGTPVRTDEGLRTIETIRPGDRVLSQDIESGELGYRAVSATTERPATAQLEIVVDGASLLATKGHPFWVDGKGWRMAKRLSVGDVLHTLEGPREIERIQAQDPAPAYNLVVDGFNTYFAGECGALVHDNKPRQPTDALTPGMPRALAKSHD